MVQDPLAIKILERRGAARSRMCASTWTASRTSCALSRWAARRWPRAVNSGQWSDPALRKQSRICFRAGVHVPNSHRSELPEADSIVHHPTTEIRLGPRSLRMTPLDFGQGSPCSFAESGFDGGLNLGRIGSDRRLKPRHGLAVAVEEELGEVPLDVAARTAGSRTCR